jgi:hypothetical protein
MIDFLGDVPAQRAHRDHEQGGGHPLARHVADEERQLSGGNLEEVEKISRDLPRREDATVNLEVRIGETDQLIGQISFSWAIANSCSKRCSRICSAWRATFSSTMLTCILMAVSKCRSSTRNPKPLQKRST